MPHYLEWFGSDRYGSLSLLATFAALGLLAGLLYFLGVLIILIRLVQRLLLGCIESGFQLWRRTLSGVPWGLFYILVIGLLALGVQLAQMQRLPFLGLLCGLALIYIGAVTCFAYLHIDIERYEVARGHKALYKPLKGQQLATNLVRFGAKVGAPMMIAAAVAVVGGFALTNQGLYDTVGRGWYEAHKYKEWEDFVAHLRAAGFEREPPPPRTVDLSFPDFLSYTLLHLFRVVDVLHIASSWRLTEWDYVVPSRWPASLLLTLFKGFFTLVLLQQVIASVRRARLLSDTIDDFWSPHAPIAERARAALAQYGPGAVRPLLRSLRSVEAVTEEQRRGLPDLLAEIGPASIPSLQRSLRDRNDNVRGLAAAALGRLHALEALPGVAALLRDPSEKVRLSVAEALGLIAGPHGQAARRLHVGGYTPALSLWSWMGRWFSGLWGGRRGSPMTSVVKALQTALADDSLEVRAKAAHSLGQLGRDAAAAGPDLMQLLDAEDEAVRCQAAEALGRVDGENEAVVAALRRLLTQANPRVRIAAIHALGALKADAATAAPDLAALVQDADETVRTAAAAAVAAVGVLHGEAYHHLTGGLTSPDDVVRARAAEALGTIGAPAGHAAQALGRALGDANDRVRAEAAEALGKMGEAAEDAVPHLMRALRDRDNWVSALAAEALGEIGESAADAAPALTRSLHHANSEVRARAAAALGKIGEPARAALPELTAAAADPVAEVRRQAAAALAEVGGLTPPARQAVLTALRDAHPDVRAAAVEAVGRLPDLHGAGSDGVLTAGEDVSEVVRAAAAAALARLTGPLTPRLEGLIRLLRDAAPSVQIEAALALGRLGGDAAAAGSALQEAARTERADVRAQALRALALIQPPEAAAAFVAGLSDAESEVRKLASAGLIKAAIPYEVLSEIISALHDHEPQVRSNAARVLARLKELPDEAVAPLRDCLADADDGVRLHAALALRAASRPLATPAFQDLLSVADLRLRLLAAGFFLEEDPAHAEAGATLVACLTNSSRPLRKAAQELIESLGPRAAALAEVLRQQLNQVSDPEISGLIEQLSASLATPNETEPRPLGSGARPAP
jgi:HEAT repeat protein